jgi:hypothetical protein
MARRRGGAAAPEPTSITESSVEELSDEKVRRWTELFISTAITELRALRSDSQHGPDSPDREVLSPAGCRTLLNVGEKALNAFMDQEDPIPSVHTSNSYRFARSEVLAWFAEQAKKPKKRRLG